MTNPLSELDKASPLLIAPSCLSFINEFSSPCLPQYQLQRCAPWRTVASQWQTWPILTIVVLLLALVTYVVYRMMTAFDNPPPHSVFKSAAIGFGLLSEALLIK